MADNSLPIRYRHNIRRMSQDGNLVNVTIHKVYILYINIIISFASYQMNKIETLS